MSSRLGEILIKESLITSDQLRQALEHQKANGGRLGTCLMKLGFISDDEITGVLSRQYGVPSINLKFYEVDASVIKLIPQDTAVRYQIVPLSRVGSTLTIAMTDPTNVFAMDDIKFMTGFNVEPVVASETAIAEAITKFYGGGAQRRRTHQGDEGSCRRRNRRPGTGLRGTGNEPRRAGTRGRGSAHHQAGEPDFDRRGQTRRQRHPHRALRKGNPRQVPHRRHPAVGDEPADEVARRHHQPHQDHGEARYQREAAAARRPHHDQVPQGWQDQGPRLPRFHDPDAVRRKDRHAFAGQGKSAPGHDQARVRAGIADKIRESDSASLRDGSGDRADRVGQDEHAIFLHRAIEHAAKPTS